MTSIEFERYRAVAVPDYAEVHRKAGDCDPEDALELAQEAYDKLLPQGARTPNHHLLTIRIDASSEAIGILWFEAREKRGRKSAYIFDFQIEPSWRGKGYGAASLQALERLVASMGITRVSLNVFGWNTGARALYERCGFQVTGIGMTKVLQRP